MSTLVTRITRCACLLFACGSTPRYKQTRGRDAAVEDNMKWHQLCRPVRLAILREAVRRGVDVEDFAATLGVQR